MDLLVKIVTVSDSVSKGQAEDRSGAALADLLAVSGFVISERRCVSDGVDEVAQVLRELAVDFNGLIITTGGTGFGPRDLTPEGTRLVLDREAPGIAEAMRLCNPLGRLSRGVAGTMARALVVNTPGSPGGAVECLEAVLDVIPHALQLLGGEQPHPHHEHAHAPKGATTIASDHDG